MVYYVFLHNLLSHDITTHYYYYYYVWHAIILYVEHQTADVCT